VPSSSAISEIAVGSLAGFIFFLCSVFACVVRRCLKLPEVTVSAGAGAEGTTDGAGAFKGQASVAIRLESGPPVPDVGTTAPLPAITDTTTSTDSGGIGTSSLSVVTPDTSNSNSNVGAAAAEVSSWATAGTPSTNPFL
jgi:hypothetical protein